MTKRQLIDLLAQECKVPKREVIMVLDKLTSTIEQTVARREKVSITGFGVFYLGNRAARRGRNPQTGDYIKIPAMRMPRFRAGSRFKKTVR